jgi:alpha-L-rhamnosidase
MLYIRLYTLWLFISFNFFLTDCLELSRDAKYPISVRDTPSFEPYLYLNNGGFTGNSVSNSPDPLVSYQWSPSVNLTALQIYDVNPSFVQLTEGTYSAAFLYLQTLVTTTPAVLAIGPGGFVVDFGVESAAWIEVDLASRPSTSDLSLIRLGLSEWSEPLQNKWREPIVYANGDFFTLRLETNTELYEGVRYGYFNLSGIVSNPLIITSMRAVSQAKPVNYTGSFFSANNLLLEKIWWTAVYSVRVNIQESYFGAVLVDRGDRYAWVGDLHPTQATDMIAFDNTWFVLQSLQQTRNLCNGIESYCIYWTLSVVDYFYQTNDTSSILALQTDVETKLQHALDIYFNLNDEWEFYGWDDRLGGGFSNASVTESQWDYRFLVLRAWLLWADVNVLLGNQTVADYWISSAKNASLFVRAQLGDFTAKGVLGVHAAAEALAAPGFASEAEQQTLLSQQLNDASSICSLSNFNSYFILLGLGHAGALDKATAMIERCWGVEINLGATCFWEVSDAEWPMFMRKEEIGGGPSVAPWGYNGNTSFCHPWSSGAAAFITKYLLGITPETPGYNSVKIAPHINAKDGRHQLSGSVPTPHGIITLSLDSTNITISIPSGCIDGARLVLSEVILKRLGWIHESNSSSVWQVKVYISRLSKEFTRKTEEVILTPLLKKCGPRIDNKGERSNCALVLINAGENVTITRISMNPFPIRSSLSAPIFPPIQWQANVVEIDTWTKGSWIGKLGSLGYSLFNFDMSSDLTLVPSFVSTISIMDGEAGNWTLPNPINNLNALQDPRNSSASRAIGYYQTFQNQLPQYTFAIDIALTPEAEGVKSFQLAVYIVDYDIGESTHTGGAEARRIVVDVKSGWPSLNPIAPPTYLPDTTGGVWVVIQLHQSCRIRITQLPGATAVASAIAFDSVQ